MSIATDIKQTIDFESGTNQNYRNVTTWYDGRPITNDLLDNDIFGKDIEGNYLQKTINKSTLLKFESIEDLRTQNGYYEGQEVTLLGYYESGDKSPLTYIFTIENFDTLIEDGGSIIKSSKGSWIAKFNDRISLRDFGAKGDDIQDDTVFIQRCFDFADANGLTAIIDVGNFKHTSQLNVGASMSIDGYFQHSVLRPNGCDCLNLLVSNGVLPRDIKNFWIYGNGAENNIGVKSIVSSGRVTGINFSNIGFSFIGKMFDLQNVWHSSITYCYGMVINGITLRGQCVKFDIFKNSILRNANLSSSSDTNGITVEFANASRPEDVNIYNNLTFGFEFGVYVETVLMVNIIQNDFDYCIKEGIKIQQGDAVLNIKNNWIAQYTNQSDSQPFTGINLVALGNINNVPKNIEGNTINGSLVGGYGINVRNNQKNVNILGNIVNNHTGIYVESDGVKIENNTINSENVSIFYAICSNVWTDKNKIIKGLTYAIGGLADKNVNFGINNSGVISTGFRTRITLPTGQVSKSGLLADLSLGDIRDNPSRLYAFCEAKTRSTFAFGNVTLTAAGDSYQLTVQNANTEDADFYCEAKCYLF